jgi:hypothetical protein
VEELKALNRRVIFYLKFHCELNFIGQFWCSAKFYARENWVILLRHYKRLFQNHFILFLGHDQSVLQAMHVDFDSI